jgi:hypothetical protein
MRLFPMGEKATIVRKIPFPAFLSACENSAFIAFMSE